MPRQEKFGCSLRMTRNSPIGGRLRHRGRAHLASRPAARRASPRSMRSFATGMRRFQRLGEVQQGVGAHERIVLGDPACSSRVHR